MDNKVRPGQNETKVWTVKNPICQVIAYTLNMNEIIFIWNESLPILRYKRSKSKIGIFGIFGQKSKRVNFRRSALKMTYWEEKIAFPHKKISHKGQNWPKLLFYRKHHIIPEPVNIFSIWKQIRNLQKIW